MPRKSGIVNCVDALTREKDVLTSLFEATQGQYWRNSDNWLSNKSVDQWFGITTNNEGRVTRVELANNNLNGTLPGELGRLAEANTLNFEANSSLSGRLPRELVKLSLETFRIGGTQLCAPEDDEFLAWLMDVTPTNNIDTCEESMVPGDREVLVNLYHSTDGPNWKNSANWLSDAPLGTWFGVDVDAEGRVTVLMLRENQLASSLPLDLSRLANLERLDLSRNSLTGQIPPELGQLDSLKSLTLNTNQLAGVIPPELGDLANIRILNLGGNLLSGVIPPELGNLDNIEQLSLGGNQLSGGIPSELGDLTTLRLLNLDSNTLTDRIPIKLGQLRNLTQLRLDQNRLSGQIPSELGEMTQLTRMELSFNDLSGGIPAELGQLANLTRMAIGFNRLSGVIPIELAQLFNLTYLSVSDNKLSGDLPAELGKLRNLEVLEISRNQFTGELPPELGNLNNLRVLVVNENPGLTGPIPISLINLALDKFSFQATDLCKPSDPNLKEWLLGITDLRGNSLNCQAPSITTLNPEVFLIQAVQSIDRTIPLLEGETALLRVLLTTDEVVMNRPAVRAEFHLDGSIVHTVEIPAGPAKIPVQVDEGSRETSANALIPGNIIVPGLELVVEIAPAGMLDPESGIAMRVPESGRIKVDVRKLPEFNLTLVPLLWTEHPNHEVVTRTEALTEEDDLFRMTRDLLPVTDFKLKVAEPLWSSHDPETFNNELFNELVAMRAMIGVTSYYMGVVSHAKENVLGVAIGSGFTSMAVLDGRIIAHELGHNLSLLHAPCGAFDYDPGYPYPDGTIGVWGYDFANDKLLDPEFTVDLMGYCENNVWISDYHYNQALFFRIRQRDSLLATVSAQRVASLLLWGGLDGDGELVLEPSFVVDAPPSLPREDGPYRLTGQNLTGNTLFTLGFDLDRVADGEGGVFAFTVPVVSEWSGRLSRITLTGPEGYAELTTASERSAAILLDQSTGKIRGILRDWSTPGAASLGARRALPEPGLEVIVSPGIPSEADWER